MTAIRICRKMHKFLNSQISVPGKAAALLLHEAVLLTKNVSSNFFLIGNFFGRVFLFVIFLNNWVLKYLHNF